MCHQRPDRSFFIGGHQFPLCARCTGILVGYFIGVIVAIMTGCKWYALFLIALLPMIIDGAIQQIRKIESTNARRFITGIIGGIGIVYCFISMHMSAVCLAKFFLSTFLGYSF